MKAVLLNGSPSEIAEVLRQTEKQTEKKPVLVQDGAFVQKINAQVATKPKAIKSAVVETVVKRTYKKRGRKRANHFNPWTPSEKLQLGLFYAQPGSHFSNGMLIGKKVEALAKSMGRTKPAIELKFCEMKLRKKGVVHGTKKYTFKKNKLGVL